MPKKTRPLVRAFYQHIILLHFLFIPTFYFTSKAISQTIIKENFYEGLMDNNGSFLLEPIYKNIAPIDGKNQYFLCQNSQELFGLYFYESKKFVACEYNEIKYSSGVFLTRKEQLWGWIIPPSSAEHSSFIIEAPQYEILEQVYNDNYQFGKESRFGVVQLNENATIKIPMIYDQKISYKKDLGYHFLAENDSLYLILGGTAPNSPETYKLSKKDIHNDGTFLHFYTRNIEKLFLFDAANGNRLPSYDLNLDKSHLFYYFEDWLCVVEKKRMSWRKKEIILRNPYTGEIFYSRILKGNEEFRLEGFNNARNLYAAADVVIYSHAGDRSYEVYEGKITQYVYNPNEQKKIVTGTYIPGDGNGPWFMPGSN